MHKSFTANKSGSSKITGAKPPQNRLDSQRSTSHVSSYRTA